MKWIILGLVVSGLIAVAVTAIRRKKQADNSIKNVKLPKTDKDEKAVLKEVEKIVGQSAKYYVVRDEAAHIPVLGMSFFDWATTQRGLKRAPYGAVIHEIVFINRHTPYPDLMHFGRTAIHELNHLAGHQHGEDMEKTDALMYNKLAKVMGWA